MGLSVIGAGFGRTGTLSLKLALERLTGGPCYHMIEVSQNPEHVPCWHAAVHGESIEWEKLFRGYAAAVDWPVCSFWRELSQVYPEAKFILTERDPRAWYESVRRTIYEVLSQPPRTRDPEALAHRAMVIDLILRDTFDGRFEDRAHAIGVYERHNEAVRGGIPPTRLLAYRVTDGWGPLCTFLGEEEPETPFPRVNSTEEFRERFRLNAPPTTG